MSKRVLYVAAYDVADPARLRRVHRVVRRFASSGQKSAFECFLNPSERRELLAETRALLDEDEDRFALLRVEERSAPVLLGAATPADGSGFLYVG